MAKQFQKAHKAAHHGATHKEPETTKLEKEDVQWPGKHSSSRTRKPKRMHEHNRHLPRKHGNW